MRRHLLPAPQAARGDGGAAGNADAVAVSVDTFLLADNPFTTLDAPGSAALGTGAPLDLVDPSPDDSAPALFYRILVTSPFSATP